MGVETGSQPEEIIVQDADDKISVSCCDITVGKGIRFSICLQSDQQDEITTAIAGNSYDIPAGFDLLRVCTRPGGRVLDLGAHVGTFALYAAASGYHVVSVEASPRNAALLRHSAEINSFDRLRVVQVAVSDHRGTLEFIQGGPYGMVANELTDSPSISVPTMPIPDILAEIGWDGVDFIKMDIEGSEVAAVRGMQDLLARPDAPALLYESNGHTLNLFGETPNHLMALLETADYTCHLVDQGTLMPCRSTDLQAECNVDYLAAKRLPADLGNWKIAAPMSYKDMVARIGAAGKSPSGDARVYTARTLARAGAMLLSDRQVGQTLQALSQDPDARVRAQMAWWTGRPEIVTPPEQPAEVAPEVQQLRRQIREQEQEIARLRMLVKGYEQGRFMRTMRTLKSLRSGLTRKARQV